MLMSAWPDLATAVPVSSSSDGRRASWSTARRLHLQSPERGGYALVAKLLRRDFTGIANRRSAATRSSGRSSASPGVVFGSRRQRSRSSAEAAVRALRRGARSGDRSRGHASRTNTSAASRRGLSSAMQAGVPIVPIVFENALDVLPGARGRCCVRQTSALWCCRRSTTHGCAARAPTPRSKRSGSSTSKCWGTDCKPRRSRERAVRRSERSHADVTACVRHWERARGARRGVARQPQRAAVLWSRRPETAEEVNHAHTNERYLPKLSCAACLRATGLARRVGSDADVVAVGGAFARVAPVLAR